MSKINWEKLLQKDIRQGATEKEIIVLEKRIGTRLPPCYREFLQTSNGWGDFLSVNKIYLINLCNLLFH